jgi:hypothetical protein
MAANQNCLATLGKVSSAELKRICRTVLTLSHRRTGLTSTLDVHFTFSYTQHTNGMTDRDRVIMDKNRSRSFDGFT